MGKDEIIVMLYAALTKIFSNLPHQHRLPDDRRKAQKQRHRDVRFRMGNGRAAPRKELLLLPGMGAIQGASPPHTHN